MLWKEISAGTEGESTHKGPHACARKGCPRLRPCGERETPTQGDGWAAPPTAQGGSATTNQVCPAANDVTAMQIQSGDTIKIKPGCYIRTMDHVISADESETIDIAIKTMDILTRLNPIYAAKLIYKQMKSLLN